MWNDLPSDKRVLWHSTVVAFFNPFYVTYSVWPEIVRGWRDFGPKESIIEVLLGPDPASLKEAKTIMEVVPTDASYYSTGLSCGFLFFDFLTMLVWWKPLLKMQKGLYTQLIVHHVFSRTLFLLNFSMDLKLQILTNLIFD